MRLPSEDPSPQRQEVADTLDEEELRLFRTRIGQSLDRQPVGLAPEAHRQAAADLVRRAGEASHYDLLGVESGASLAELHDAYDRTARLVHPRHALALGLAGREGVLQHLFERVTHAYLTLIHPGRRKEYDSGLGDRLWRGDPSRRQEEGRQIAKRYFVRAEMLAAQEDFHQAIELLRQAVRTDPRAEYYALLGQCQARNPLWLRHAEESLNRAVQLGDRRPELLKTLERVRSELSARAQGSEPGRAG
jgi:curved DNA-binding protein CbpA